MRSTSVKPLSVCMLRPAWSQSHGFEVLQEQSCNWHPPHSLSSLLFFSHFIALSTTMDRAWPFGMAKSFCSLFLSMLFTFIKIIHILPHLSRAGSLFHCFWTLPVSGVVGSGLSGISYLLAVLWAALFQALHQKSCRSGFNGNGEQVKMTKALQGSAHGDLSPVPSRFFP